MAKGVSIGVNVDASRGVQGFRQIEREVASTEQSMKRMSTQARATGAELDRAFARKVSLDPFTASVARATSGLDGLATRLRSIPAAVAGMGGALGLGAGGLAVGVLAIAKAAANAAGQIDTLAQRTGLGTESLSRLAYAVKVTGGETSDLESGLQSLTKNIQSAAKGGNASAAMFDQLGIAVTRSDGSLRSADEVFIDLAQRFSELPNGATKTSAAVALLGNAAERLVPALNQGREGLQQLANESDRAGQTISEAAAQAAREFNANLERMQLLVNAVVVQIGNALIPTINQLATDFLRAKEAGLSFGQALLNIGLSNPFKTAEEQVESLTEKLLELKGRREDALRFVGGRAEASAVLPQIEAEIALRQRELAYWESKVKESAGAPDLTEEKKRSEERLKIERELSAEISQLNKLRETAATNATKEEIRGAERLRDALRTAWRESAAAAREARRESAEFFSQARQASASRNAEANRIEAEAEQKSGGLRGASGNSAQALIREAERAALFAQNAAFDGRADAVRQNAEEALRLAEEAAGYVRGLGDDPSAARLLRQIGEAESQALKAQGKLREQEADAQEAAADGIDGQLQAVEGRITALKASLAQPVSVEVEIAQAEKNVDALLSRLNLLQDKTVTITVNRVDTGGSAAAVGAEEGFATGGYVRGPGTGTSDSILARLSNGEYVIRAEAVRRYGLSMLNRINSLRLPRFASGGLVSAQSPVLLARTGSDRPSQTPINLHIGDQGPFPMQTSQDVAAEVTRIFQRAALQRGRRK